MLVTVMKWKKKNLRGTDATNYDVLFWYPSRMAERFKKKCEEHFRVASLRLQVELNILTYTNQTRNRYAVLFCLNL
jgi:hypothetical protein